MTTELKPEFYRGYTIKIFKNKSKYAGEVYKNGQFILNVVSTFASSKEVIIDDAKVDIDNYVWLQKRKAI